MRSTASRLAKLEKVYACKLGGCQYCGGIDPKTRSRPFYGGITLLQDDGTYFCMCKLCGWMFRARLEQEDGRCVAHEVAPDLWDFFRQGNVYESGGSA